MFKWISDGFSYAINSIIWKIFIQGPLTIINAFSAILNYLTGGIITDIMFGGTKEFSWSNIPSQFFTFCILATCIFAIIFVVQMIVLMLKDEVQIKVKFVLAIQNSLKGFMFILLIPIFFFIANFIIKNVAMTITQNFGQKNSSIAHYLYHIGDVNWDGITTRANNDFSYPSNIKDYNMFAQLFATLFMTYCIFVMGILLVQKVIELFFLFVISPIVMVNMVIDEGKSALAWKDIVITKFLSSSTTLIGYWIFIGSIQALLKTNMKSLESITWAKPILIIFFICGGGMASLSFNDLLAHFIGEKNGIREGMNSLKSTMTGGLGLIGTTNILSKFRRNKNKSSGNDKDTGKKSIFKDINDKYQKIFPLRKKENKITSLIPEKNKKSFINPFPNNMAQFQLFDMEKLDKNAIKKSEDKKKKSILKKKD
ncbi:MAG: hypothetical protein E7Y34_00325 [Mycoplasma sp.]|nr:hypothetical protein [Mycoplasma sp.]